MECMEIHMLYFLPIFGKKWLKNYWHFVTGKTAKSILISCGARLAVFDIAELREVTSYDELELDTLGDRKTALFLIMSDTDDIIICGDSSICSEKKRSRGTKLADSCVEPEKTHFIEWERVGQGRHRPARSCLKIAIFPKSRAEENPRKTPDCVTEPQKG